MLSTLTARYGDDAAANMIALAEKEGTGQTKRIAGILARQEKSTWSAEKHSADDVFKLLKLDEAQGPILEKPALQTWLEYAFREKENPYKILFSKLRTRYGDDGLVQILIPATRVRDTFKLAGKLDDMLLQSWQLEKYSAVYVFKLLKLDEQQGNVFANPEFIAWRSYLARLDTTNPDKMMYVTLKTRYGDGGIQDMMSTAKESANRMRARIKEISRKEGGVPDDIRKVALLEHDVASTNTALARLREEIWRNEGKSGDDIFKMLKLDEHLNGLRPYDIFRDSDLGTWASYVSNCTKSTRKTLM